VNVLRARPWTSHEDIILQRLAAAGKHAATIAAEMSRSEAAMVASLLCAARTAWIWRGDFLKEGAPNHWRAPNVA
jgi:hypothetical protein